MRIKLVLKSNYSKFITTNYFHGLSSAIYKLLKFGSKEFAQFLHDKGFELGNKNYKLFTFALKFENYEINFKKINLISPYAYLYISTPLIDDFVKFFLIGSFEQKEIQIFSHYTTTSFIIKNIEIIPDPLFSSEMHLNCLSPIAISTMKQMDGKLKTHFITFEDNSEYHRILNKNLINKYKILTGKEHQGDYVQIDWDSDYVIKKKGRIQKRIIINENSEHPIDVIGIQCPFKIKGPTELIKVGYECGFGEKNSIGFGMTEVIQ